MKDFYALLLFVVLLILIAAYTPTLWTEDKEPPVVHGLSAQLPQPPVTHFIGTKPSASTLIGNAPNAPTSVTFGNTGEATQFTFSVGDKDYSGLTVGRKGDDTILTIVGKSKTLATIHSNGKVTMTGSPDEAAILFWKAIGRNMPQCPSPIPAKPCDPGYFPKYSFATHNFQCTKM